MVPYKRVRNLAEPGENVQEPEDRPSHRWLWFVAFVLVVIGVVIMALPTATRTYFRRGLSPVQEALLDKKLKEPLSIPQSWREAVPFPQVLLDDVAVLEREINTITSATATIAMPVSEDDWTSARGILASAGRVLDAVSTVTSNPTYDMDVALAFDRKANDGYGVFRRAGDLLLLQATVLARDGDFPSAIQSITKVFRLQKRNDGALFLSHLVGINMQVRAYETAVRLTGETSNTEHLGQLRKMIFDSSTQISRGTLSDITRTFVIGDLRMLNRIGAPVQFPEGVSTKSYIDQVLFLHTTYANRMLRSGTGPPAVWKNVASEVSFHFSTGEWDEFVIDILNKPILRPLLYEVIYQQFILRNDFAYEPYERVAFAKSRLAAVEIDRRMAEIEGRSYGPGDLAPDVRDDPFSSSTLRLANGVFYSVGPDGIDQGGSVECDLDTAKAGDVFFARKKR